MAAEDANNMARWTLLLIFGVLCAAASLPADAQDADADTARTGPGDSEASLKQALVLKPEQCHFTESGKFTTVVRLQVTAKGLPSMVSVSKTSGNDCLDAVVLEAVQKARFRPARHLGQAVVRNVLMPVDYTNELPVGQQPGVTPPVIVRTPEVDISKCSPTGRETPAVVRLTVDRQGNPTNLRIERGSGNDCFDEAALAAVGRYSFKPGLLAGQPVAVLMQVEVDIERK